MGRFLNADSYASTGQGIIGNNMFAYCSNNSVNYVDAAGTMRNRSQVSMFQGDRTGASQTYEEYEKMAAEYNAVGITLYRSEWEALMDWRSQYLPLSEEYEYVAFLYCIENEYGKFYHIRGTYCGSKGNSIVSPNVVVPTVWLSLNHCIGGGNLIAQVHTHPKPAGWHNDWPSYDSGLAGGDRWGYTLLNNLFGIEEMYVIPYSRCDGVPAIIAITDRSTWCPHYKPR